jgi:hypothetical protein
MVKTTDAGDRIPLLNELGRLGPHPALKAGEGGGLLHQRLQKDRLGHPDGVGILGHDGVEGKSACGLAVDADQPFGEGRVRLR